MTKNVKTVNKNFYLISVLTPIIKSESEKIDETGRNTALGKVLSFVEGKVEARAWRCNWHSRGWISWSGIYFELNKCAQQWAMGVSGAIFAGWFIALAGCTVASWGVCGWLLGFSGTIAMKALQLIWGLANNPRCQLATIKLKYPLLTPWVSC